MSILKTPFLLRKWFWIGDFFKGSPMWHAYCDVRNIAENRNGTASQRRNELLTHLLEHAKNNTEFYKDNTYKSLSDYPVVNKQTILGNYDAFFVAPDKIPGQKGKVHVQKTSGSTGTPFEIRQDTNCRTRRIATIKYENDLIGFHSFEPMMHLRAFAHYWGGEEKIRYAKDLNIWYADNADLTDERVKEILDTIIYNKIKYVRGYMTSLDIITRYAVEHGIEFTHEVFFISVGELLLESLRNRIVNDLHCHLISQYGNEENGIFGSTDIDGVGTEMNLNGANCIVEILKLDSDEPVEGGELGRIVVTDLTNYAMPMIRYEIGDVAAIGNMSDDGIITKIVKLSGRKTDLILKQDGTHVDFFNSVPKEVYNNPKIRQWQFIQHSLDNCTLKLTTVDALTPNEEQFFKASIQDLLGATVTVNIAQVDEIPVLSSGKRKVVINEIGKK